MSKFRIGVFKIGNAWRVWGEDGALGRFSNRKDALAAARIAAKACAGQGVEVEINLLDKSGEVARLYATAY